MSDLLLPILNILLYGYDSKILFYFLSKYCNKFLYNICIKIKFLLLFIMILPCYGDIGNHGKLSRNVTKRFTMKE